MAQMFQLHFLPTSLCAMFILWGLLPLRGLRDGFIGTGIIGFCDYLIL